MDLRFLAVNQPSLCIPRVFMNITEERIRHVLDQVGLGSIDHVDILVRKSEKGDEYKRVFIHFTEWYWNKDAQAARTKLISGKEIKLVYDEPWFWKVSANNWQPTSAVKPALNQASKSRPHIEFDDDEPRVTRVPSNERRDDERRRIDDRRVDERRVDDRRVTHVPSNDRRVEDRRVQDHRQDNRRVTHVPSNDRRVDDRRVTHVPSNKKKQMPLPIAPALNIAPALPVAPTLKPKAPALPTVSPAAAVEGVNVQYDTRMPSKRVLKMKPKQKAAEKVQQKVEEAVDEIIVPKVKSSAKVSKTVLLEEGEVVEVDGMQVTQEELKDFDELYGDLL